MKKDYITEIRKKVGHDPIILTFAGGILTNKNNEILLQKRADFNSWGLPGGALEFGETAEEACKREYLEETGLKVKVTSLLGVSTNQIQHYPNNDIAQAIVIAFIVKYLKKDEIKISPETLALKYFAQNELPSIFNQQHKKLIKNYFSGNYPFFD
ncbi:NUDIX hydrolase [Lactobacillus sp. ESL0791]|uniref:NUDIX hydrolase n=1 Tax=Lactobacillus sp. ESL0791 TaxID=2983234 RepID=UPI0023F9D7D9|nr:NUDIX hydrolase [Lactobacillus sp. ESL0791]MDF7639011.1 NUDIX hydrolase [Lactobacillus sp. ESL0791]